MPIASSTIQVFTQRRGRNKFRSEYTHDDGRKVSFSGFTNAVSDTDPVAIAFLDAEEWRAIKRFRKDDVNEAVSQRRSPTSSHRTARKDAVRYGYIQRGMGAQEDYAAHRYLKKAGMPISATNEEMATAFSEVNQPVRPKDMQKVKDRWAELVVNGSKHEDYDTVRKG